MQSQWPSLEALGWNADLAVAFAPFATHGYLPGRVASEHTHLYQVWTGREQMLARVAGRLRHQAPGRHAYPAVGDWVAVEPRPRGQRGLIQAVMPRRSRFSRKAAGAVSEEQVVAANIDTVFLVSGLDADFNPRRIERYVVAAWDSGASPVIVLNKADLCQQLDERLAEVATVAPGVPIEAVSAATGAGLDRLRHRLRRGETVAFLGSSGVGKSTLINRLTGRDLLPTREVRASDSRGRHASAHRQLVVLPEGALVIDTPGMRELQLWEGEEGVSNAFADIEALAAGCHFRDCRHRDEPSCAVKAAVAEGQLAPARLASYQKLLAEIGRQETRPDRRAQLAEKRRTRVIGGAARKRRGRE